MININGIRYRDGGFTLDPCRPEDSKQYFGRPDRKASIDSLFSAATLFNTNPHTLIWGGSFSGKTHTLAYIKFLVQQKYGMTEDDIIELIVGAGIKNDFVKFHGMVMDGINQNKFGKTIRKFIKELEQPTDGSDAKIQENMYDEQVFKVYVDQGLNSNFVKAILYFNANRQQPQATISKVWRWLCGRDTTPAERAEIGVDRDTKKDPDMALDILSNYFTMYNIAHRGKKKTILLFDEMNNLTSAKDEIFVNCLRELTRKDNLTIVLAFSATSLKKLGNIVNEHVYSHLPAESIINLLPFDTNEQETEVTSFVRELIAYHRDRTIDLSECIEKNKHVSESVDETLTEEFFPFTNEIIKNVGAWIDQQQEPKRKRYPGEIMRALNDFVTKGLQKDPNTIIFTKAKILPDI